MQVPLIRANKDATSSESQLANLDLLDARQKQAQMFSMIASVMKTLHEASQTVIRNMK